MPTSGGYIHEWRSTNIYLLIVFITSLKILLGGDVEPNPGPPKYPCGECNKACTSYRGARASILCDTCDTWYHAECVGMSGTMLSLLGNTDLPWECHRCGFRCPSPSLFDSTCYSNDDSISSDSSQASSLSSSPASGPSATPPAAQKLSNIRILVINFQSILSKTCELACVIDTTKPDIIIGCETWLKPTISQGEFLPNDYVDYRKDRPDNYGGVLLGIHSSLNSHEVKVATDTEFVAAKILSGKQSIVVGSFYRPPSNDQSRIHGRTL